MQKKSYTLVNASDAASKFNDLKGIKAIPVFKHKKYYSFNGSECYSITLSDNLTDSTSIAIMKTEGTNKYMYFMHKYWKVLDKSTSNLFSALATLIGAKKNGSKDYSRKPQGN